MKLGRISRTVQKTTRNNPQKGKCFKIRNWNGYNQDGVKEVTTAPEKKLTKIQKAKKAAEEALKEQKALETKNSLERTPDTDIVTFIDKEEQGYFQIGDKIVKTIFPR